MTAWLVAKEVPSIDRNSGCGDLLLEAIVLVSSIVKVFVLFPVGSNVDLYDLT